ncbi:MAG: flavodoxin-dependent (E)-4-hydroxy-3-methylbut-2-enyl-diphosphate synthase [Anaerovoracaceae bacterium]
MSKKSILIRDIKVGGGAPISIQSMTNTDTRDVNSTLNQIEKLKEAGCEIVRLAIPDMKAAEAFKEIRRNTEIPLVADIHFDFRLAIETIKNGADKIRINPGNIGDIEKIRKVIDTAKEYEVPIRVGVNSGSLEKSLLEKYGGVTAEALVESAINNVKILESMDFHQIVISIKSSNVQTNVQAYRLISKELDYPLHLGVTEAGTIESGSIKSAVGIGSLLLDNIGDTIRVSLTGDPCREIPVAEEILFATGKRENFLEIISCPTCGRTEVELEEYVNSVKKELKVLDKKKILKIAIMGCEVNGPGEAKEADYGIAFGKGKAAIFSKGKVIKAVPVKEAVSSLIKIIEV